jgi:hypothetical protein
MKIGLIKKIQSPKKMVNVFGRMNTILVRHVNFDNVNSIIII